MLEYLKIIAGVFGIIAAVFVGAVGISILSVYLSTHTGKYVISHNGDKIEAVQVTFLNSDSISYTKNDGTYGRVYGNFQVERVVKVEK